MTAAAGAGLLASLAGASVPGRAARGSVSPRKATCQVPASGLSSFGPRPPTRAKSHGKGPASAEARASRRPCGPRRSSSAGRTLTSPTGVPRSSLKGVFVFWLFARDEPLRGPRQHSGWTVNDNRVGPILDRKLNVGFADRNPVHLAAMGALSLQCLLPGSGQAVWVGLDTGRGSTMGSGAYEEQRRHNTLQ